MKDYNAAMLWHHRINSEMKFGEEIFGYFNGMKDAHCTNFNNLVPQPANPTFDEESFPKVDGKCEAKFHKEKRRFNQSVKYMNKIEDKYTRQLTNLWKDDQNPLRDPDQATKFIKWASKKLKGGSLSMPPEVTSLFNVNCGEVTFDEKAYKLNEVLQWRAQQG